jgi:hypothetical protein
MKKLITFTLLLLFVFSTVAWAEEGRWTVIKSKDGNVMSIDSKTITINKYHRQDKPSGQILTCWIKLDIASQEYKNKVQQQTNKEYPKKNIDFSNQSYVLWKWHFDAQSDECYEEVVIYYDANGKEIFREPIKQNWCVIEPESMEETFYNAAKAQR